jgi:hypothetical protein
MDNPTTTMFRIWDTKEERWFTSGRVSIWMRQTFAERACPNESYWKMTDEMKAQATRRYAVVTVEVAPTDPIPEGEIYEDSV